MDHYVLQIFPLTNAGEEEALYFMGFEDFLGIELTTECDQALKLNEEQAEKVAALITYMGRFQVVIWQD